MLDSVITLVREEKHRTERGFNDPVEHRRKVFAEKKSPRQTEFYLAKQIGMRLSAEFTVNTDEYHGEKKLECDGVLYSVERSFEKNRLHTVLICSEVI